MVLTEGDSGSYRVAAIWALKLHPGVTWVLPILYFNHMRSTGRKRQGRIENRA